VTASNLAAAHLAIALLGSGCAPPSPEQSAPTPTKVENGRQGQSGEASSCRVVHGRIYLSNGTPSVHVQLPNGDVLGVVEQDTRFDELPPNLRQIWKARGSDDMWDNDVVGDFTVCAMFPGGMGHEPEVSVKAAENLSISSKP